MEQIVAGELVSLVCEPHFRDIGSGLGVGSVVPSRHMEG
jgi:hypothetical protein